MTETRDDVRRLFERLVEVLGRSAPHLIGEPIPVADLYERLVPYRTNRHSMGFDTNQDYEMALLRLLAGEQGLADLDHDEGRDALAREASAINPNPSAFRAYATALVHLNQAEADAILVRRESFSPPVMAPGPEVPVAEPTVAGPPRQLPFAFESPAQAGRKADAAELCPHCDEALPQGRIVAYCPFCGGNVTSRACPECGTSLDTAWRHCITCGHRMP